MATAAKDKAAEVKDAAADKAHELKEKAVEAKVKELTDAAKVEKKDDGVDPAILKNLALIGQ